MLKSTSGTEPSLPPHTRDAAPIKSKVAPWLTAWQGIDYHSTARTVYFESPPGRASPPHGSPYGRRYPICRNHRSGPATYVHFFWIRAFSCFLVSYSFLVFPETNLSVSVLLPSTLLNWYPPFGQTITINNKSYIIILPFRSKGFYPDFSDCPAMNSLPENNAIKPAAPHVCNGLDVAVKLFFELMIISSLMPLWIRCCGWVFPEKLTWFVRRVTWSRTSSDDGRLQCSNVPKQLNLRRKLKTWCAILYLNYRLRCVNTVGLMSEDGQLLCRKLSYSPVLSYRCYQQNKYSAQGSRSSTHRMCA